MPRFTYMLNSFKAGELGPKVHARTDTEQYREGLDTLENFFIETSGGAFRRGGFGTVEGPNTTMADGGENISLVYQYNRDSVYRLDIKVTSTPSISIEQTNTSATPTYAVGEAVLASSAATEIVKGANDIHGYSYVQIDQIIVLVHNSGDMAPITFVPSLNSSGEFCIVAYTWDFDTTNAGLAGLVTGTPTSILLEPDNWLRESFIRRLPVNDPNVSSVQLNPSGTSGSITITASSDFFFSGMESDSGRRNGTQLLLDDGTGKILYANITAISTTTSATADVLTAEGGYATGNTDYWYASSWGKYSGYPKCVEVHDGRLVFGGTKTKPSTVWGSFPFAYGQLNRFIVKSGSSTSSYKRVASEQDGGVQYTIASEGNTEEIRWLKSNRTLLLGTNNKEYAVNLSPTNVSFTPQSNHGGDARSAVNAYNGTYFISENGRDIYEVRYSEENGAFVSRRLTDLNDEILYANSENILDREEVKYVQLVYLESIKTLFALTNSFNIIAISIDPNSNTLAFSKVVSENTRHRYMFRARDSYEGENLLYTRSVNTASPSPLNDREWVLKMGPYNDGDVFLTSSATNFLGEPVFLDYAKLGTNSPASAIIDLGSDYADLDLVILARSTAGPVGTKIFTNVTANSSGVVNLGLGQEVSHYIAGVPYTSKLKTLTLEVGPNQLLNSQGDTIRLDRATAKLFRSLGGYYGNDDTSYELEGINEEFISSSFTGEKRLDIPLGPDTDNKFVIQTNKPLPLNILGIVLRGQNNP